MILAMTVSSLLRSRRVVAAGAAGALATAGAAVGLAVSSAGAHSAPHAVLAELDCRAILLQVTLGAHRTTDDGATDYPIHFKTRNGDRCQIPGAGYPHVVAIGNKDRQLGPAAEHVVVRHKTPVVLTPDNEGTATLMVKPVVDFPASECHATAIGHLLVSVPGDSSTRRVMPKFKTCFNPEIHVMHVTPILVK